MKRKKSNHDRYHLVKRRLLVFASDSLRPIEPLSYRYEKKYWHVHNQEKK